MSLSITGSQFVVSGGVRTYTVSGISAGYTLSSVILPNGWVLDSSTAISGGSQDHNVTCGIGSGTIIVTYANGSLTESVYYDVYSGATRMGEEIIQDGAIFLPGASASTIPPVICGVTRCPYILDVFADDSDFNNDLKNDKSDFYFYGDANISSIIMTLQKLINGVWTDSISFSDSTYGQFFAFGKHPDFSGNNFTDDFNKKYTGLFLDWLKVLNLRGAGMYRMKIVYTDIFSVINTYFSQSQYALYQWNCIKINGTVRIESFNQGLRGTLNNNTIQIDYSTGWKSQIRLRGLFLYTGSTYNKEYNQYGDADYNVYKPIIHEQASKYVLTKLYVPGWLVWYLSTNVNQADTIQITDYNTSNRFTLVKTPVMADSDLTLLDNNLVDSSGDVMVALKLQFTYAQNNLRKRNS